MNYGKNPTPSKLRAVMIYLSPEDADGLKKFAQDRHLSSSKIAREGLQMRMNRDADRYELGFNEGLAASVQLVRETKGAQMMFPSGKSFADLVCEGLEPLKRKIKNA